MNIEIQEAKENIDNSLGKIIRNHVVNNDFYINVNLRKLSKTVKYLTSQLSIMSNLNLETDLEPTEKIEYFRDILQQANKILNDE